MMIQEERKSRKKKRESVSSTGKRKCSEEVKTKRQRFGDRPKESNSVEEGREINPNVCCEECVDDCMKDEEGKDRICPYCLDDLSKMYV